MTTETNTKEIVSKLQELIDLTYTLNTCDFNVFFRFFGHVDRIDVDVDLGGWEDGRTERNNIICNQQITLDSVTDAIIKLKNIHDTYRESQKQTIETIELNGKKYRLIED